MEDFFDRSESLIGAKAMDEIRAKRVIIFGVGGVGSWAAECLIRTGLTHLTIVDGDMVQPSNINRQLPATQQTIGRPKVEALRERLLSINPDAEIVALPLYYGEQGRDKEKGYDFQIADYSYIIDAIDDVPAKTDLILYASCMRETKLFSSMGAALRMDPTQVTIGELMSIQGDGLAKAVRARMKRIGLKPSRKIRCVYSTEVAQRGTSEGVKGSLMQVTAVFGCTLASMVINDITCANG